MSTTRAFARFVAFSAATVGAVVASLALASPAYAADVDVRIGNVPDINAGGQPRRIDSTTTNKDKQPILNVQHAIVIKLDGVQPQHVKIAQGGSDGQQLQVESTGNGEVRAIDGEGVDLGAEGQGRSIRRKSYWIAFVSDAPTGRADLTFSAFVDGNLLDSDSDGFTVKGAAGQPTKTTNQPPTSGPVTSAGPVPTFAAGPQYSIAPLQENQASADDNAGVPMVLYVLGGVLVAAGGAILWLLFRPRPDVAGAYPTGDYPVNTAFSPYRPMSPANLHPTAVMPAVRDPHVMPEPGVDPWASQHGASQHGASQDSTREIGPFGPRP